MSLNKYGLVLMSMSLDANGTYLTGNYNGKNWVRVGFHHQHIYKMGGLVHITVHLARGF